jgi:cytochrome c biogenesis protein CcdA
MNALLTYIVVAALIDSANLNAMAAQIYLLSTPKPTKRSLFFIAGNFLANLIGGLLIVFGFTQILFQIFERFSEIIYLFQFLLGIALVLFGCYFDVFFSRPKIVKKLKSLKAIYAFFLGATVALSDIFTALPYLAAIEKIVQTKSSFFQTIGFLTLYNFIFPLVILLSIYLHFQQKSVAILAYIQQFVNRWVPKIIRVIQVNQKVS